MLVYTAWPSGSGVRLESGRPGFDSRFPRGNFSGLSHTSDLEIGTPVGILPDAWRYRVSLWTGWPGVDTQYAGEVESLISNFSLSVAARTLV